MKLIFNRVKPQKRSLQMEKICFVIAPIGDEESETRKRSDLILKHVIKPATAECGYNAIRADEISEPGIITSQVIQHIVDDPLVIADLSERNPNVFYELALRHALKKPLVQIMKKGETIPFDVAGMRTILIDHHDLDSVEEAKKEIVAQIESIENKAPEEIETPISVSLDLQMLRQSDKSEERTLADILSAVSELRSGIDALEKRISNPETLLPPAYFRHLSREMDRHINPASNEIMFELELFLRRFEESGAMDKSSEEFIKLKKFINDLIFMRKSSRHVPYDLKE